MILDFKLYIALNAFVYLNINNVLVYIKKNMHLYFRFTLIINYLIYKDIFNLFWKLFNDNLILC